MRTYTKSTLALRCLKILRICSKPSEFGSKKVKEIKSGNQKKFAARLCAVQGLYEISMGDVPQDVEAFIADIRVRAKDYTADADIKGAPHPTLLGQLVQGVLFRTADLDAKIDACLSDKWNKDRVLPLVRMILRCGVFELMVLMETPTPVVISEYVKLAELFFDEPEKKLVHALLDKIAKEIRA